jgi:hypothetical protein
VSVLDQQPRTTTAKASRLPQNVVRLVRRRGGYGIATTGVTVAGTPDYLGSYRGRMLAWEFKTGTGRTTPKQDYELAQWAATGADTAVIRSVDDARTRLDQIDKEHET